jgi:hypothetical protein
MVQPERYGLPCWSENALREGIANLAQLDKTRSHYFLAAHTPIENLIDLKSADNSCDEQHVFEGLNRPGEEIVCLIHGDPGVGKSHLIHWLKLRFDTAIKNDECASSLNNLETILVRRGDGTLRSALEQITEQLGEDFAQYLTPIKNAIGKISNENRLELLQLKCQRF